MKKKILRIFRLSNQTVTWTHQNETENDLIQKYIRIKLFNRSKQIKLNYRKSPQIASHFRSRPARAMIAVIIFNHLLQLVRFSTNRVFFFFFDNTSQKLARFVNSIIERFSFFFFALLSLLTTTLWPGFRSLWSFCGFSISRVHASSWWRFGWNQKC